jgi:hypothetical protein
MIASGVFACAIQALISACWAGVNHAATQHLVQCLRSGLISIGLEAVSIDGRRADASRAGRYHGQVRASARANHRLTRDTDSSNSRASAVIESPSSVEAVRQTSRSIETALSHP